ncbi:hypothetical protein [Shinella zoogloeoides]|uniref:hypothetical protein n=1 Tax=Shinella zoogloeoides TaxID=352475 RepID=UPI0028AD4A89|nr:hypothetical protein [Shinella zoogloeoides]
MAKYDLAKTQFLDVDHGTHHTLKAYRRKRALMLFDKEGKPVRLITWANWQKLISKYPHEVEAEKLSVKTVWTLVPAKP